MCFYFFANTRGKLLSHHTNGTFGFANVHSQRKNQKSHFLAYAYPILKKNPTKRKLLKNSTIFVKSNCTINIQQMKTNKLVGEILREKREEKGLYLRHVSAQLDIDTAILSKIERSERKATKEQIVKLAEILDLDKEELLILYLSEKILYEIKDEELGEEALKVAEQKIKYKNKHK